MLVFILLFFKFFIPIFRHVCLTIPTYVSLDLIKGIIRNSEYYQYNQESGYITLCFYEKEKLGFNLYKFAFHCC